MKFVIIFAYQYQPDKNTQDCYFVHKTFGQSFKNINIITNHCLVEMTHLEIERLKEKY